MAIELVRIDDRLIHGQVMTMWVKNYNIEQIIIVDDNVAKDETRKQILKFSIPENIKLAIFGVEKFINITKKTSINRRTLLLLADPLVALKLNENGVKFSELNVGNISNNDVRERVTKSISLTEDEKEYFRKLEKNKVNVYIQMVPNDKKENILDIIK